jgi:hypothetical protein
MELKMNKFHRCIFVLGCLAMIAGCAQVPMAPEPADIEAKKFSPPAGKGSLYIHRHETLGGSVAIPVFVNGINVGQTAAHTYILLNLVPGSYTVESNAPENTARLNIKIKQGENTFIWHEPKMAILRGFRVGLTLSDQEEGKRAVLDSKRIAMSEFEPRILPLDANPASQTDLSASRLREITKLRSEGIISEQEFQDKRKELMEKL